MSMVRSAKTKVESIKSQEAVTQKIGKKVDSTGVLQRAMLDSQSLTPGELMQLQKFVGNQMVYQLLSDSESGQVLQRNEEESELERETGVSEERTLQRASSNPIMKIAGAGVIQRQLDEDFDHGGIPQPGETQACHDFAKKVSDYVDQAYNDLLSGNVSSWKGAKIATFLELLYRGSSTAHTHAANAIEERVYALMPQNKMMGLKWVPQFSESMGGVSKPDIVIHLDSGSEALVDITSDRGHILGKGGAWTTSAQYVYVAEAYFPSITKDDVKNIKAALEKGGIGLAEAQSLKAQADLERKQRMQEKKDKADKIRYIYNQFNSFTEFAMNYHKFDGVPKNKRVTVASKFLLMHGIRVKGMRIGTGRRRVSDETKKKARMKARKVRAKKMAVTAPQTQKTD